jgi:hypothetical protein
MPKDPIEKKSKKVKEPFVIPPVPTKPQQCMFFFFFFFFLNNIS